MMAASVTAKTNPASDYSPLYLVGRNFWILRANFFVVGGILNIGTQMAFIKLESGKFLVVDTVEIKEGSAEKNAVDRLTDGGKLIEAVVATHAFHTMFFAPFNKLYPGLDYYGTPRHLRKITEITWSGNLIDEAIRSKWESEGVLMRVPEGSEFENPAEDNHFVGVFLLHQGSKTLFVDDTLMYYTNLGCILRCFVRNNTLKFHPSLYSNGLHPTSEAPLHFLEWIRKLNEDWEFDNICTAHVGNLIGSGNQQLGILVEASVAKLHNLSHENKKTKK